MPVVISGTNGITNATWTTAGRPSAPSTGQQGYNSTLGVMEFYNGSAWVQGGGFTTQSVQTTGFTAVAGNIYPCNTTSAAFTVTLPASPIAGNQIQIIDYAGTFATNNVTLGRNGSNITGDTFNYLLKTNRLAVILTYIDATQGWVASSAAYSTAPIVATAYTASYLLVAGGGGGGGSEGTNGFGGGGGGGGAGGLLTGTTTVNVGTTYSFTVGGGGSAGVNGFPSGATNGANGSNSTGFSLTAIGGGGGGGEESTTSGSGGSGGGQGGDGGTTAGSGTSGQGFAGGGQGNRQGGGGGGAAENGSTDGGSQGGDGLASSITGSSVFYAGGGGGGQGSANTSNAAGGDGGGGQGGSTNGTSNSSQGWGGEASGTANTGGGGGAKAAGRSDDSRGAGGSGVVILSVPTINYSSTTTGSPTVTTSGLNTIIKFTASGSYTA
jgi:hypothetical protein